MHQINVHLFRITVLYYAIRFNSLPLEVVIAHDRLPMSQDSVVLARERALRAPNVSQVTFHFDVLTLRDVLTATSDNYLELQVTDVFNRVILFADNLTYKRVRSTWEDEVMLFAEERFKFVELFRDWFLVA